MAHWHWPKRPAFRWRWSFPLRAKAVEDVRAGLPVLVDRPDRRPVPTVGPPCRTWIPGCRDGRELAVEDGSAVDAAYEAGPDGVSAFRPVAVPEWPGEDEGGNYHSRTLRQVVHSVELGVHLEEWSYSWFVEGLHFRPRPVVAVVVRLWTLP